MLTRTDAAPVVDYVKIGPPSRGGRHFRSAKVRPAVLLWALGVPIPIILLVVLIRGCM